MLTPAEAANLYQYVDRAQESNVSGSPRRTQELLVELTATIAELTDYSERAEIVRDEGVAA